MRPRGLLGKKLMKGEYDVSTGQNISKLETLFVQSEPEKIIHIWEPVDNRDKGLISIVSHNEFKGPQLVSDDVRLPYLVAYVLAGRNYSLEGEANAMLIARTPALYLFLKFFSEIQDSNVDSVIDSQLISIMEKLLAEIDKGRIRSNFSTEIRCIDREVKNNFLPPNRNEFGQYTSMVVIKDEEQKTTINRLLNTWGAFLAAKTASLNINRGSTDNQKEYYCIFAPEPDDRKMVPMPIIAIVPIQDNYRRAEINALLISRAPILHLLVADFLKYLKQGINPRENKVLLKTTKFVLDEIQKGEVCHQKAMICWD